MANESLNMVLFFVALLFSAGFSSSEAAFLSIQRGKLAVFSKVEPRKAQRVARFAHQPEKLLATVLTGNNLANTAAAALGTSIALAYLDRGPAVVVSTVIVTIVLLVFGEAIPKTFATRYPIGFASIAAAPLRAVEALLLPPIWLLERLMRGLTAVLGLPNVPIVSQEELQALIEMGAESGEVEEKQADILDQVFRMQDRRISDVMTHRTDIVGIPEGTTLDEFLAVYRQTSHTRYPVYRGSLDRIVGILTQREIFAGLADGKLNPDDDVTALARTPTYMPETKLMGDVFRHLHSLGAEMFVLVDEYGGVIGIATVRQMIEELVGHFDEHAKPAGQGYSVIEGGVISIQGDMQVDEANEVLSLGIPSGPYETVSGFFMTRSGAIPHVGSTLVHGSYQYEIEAMDEMRVARLVARPVEPPPAPMDSGKGARV